MKKFFLFFISLTIFPQVAIPQYYDVVRDKDGDIVVNTFGNCVRTMWEAPVDYCAKPAKQMTEIPAPAPEETKAVKLESETTIVYFDFNQSNINDEAKKKLDSLINNVKSEKIAETVISGYADRIGSKEANQRLSDSRATAVKNYLNQNGVISPTQNITKSFGEEKSNTNCAATEKPKLIECLADDRKVEVEIKVKK